MGALTQFLEINLISAQGLNRQTRTYAIAWVDSSTKLRTQINRVGGKNQTWNDKFMFKVAPDFFSGETSAISIEIYAVGIFRDKLIGTVRVLISSFLPVARMSPAFAAFLIRRPSSGEFFGILNVGALVLNSFTGFRALSKASGIDYHDLAGEKFDSKRCVIRSRKKSKATVGDIPGYKNHNDLSESEPNTSFISPLLTDLSLKQSVGNKKKRLWIKLRRMLKMK